MGHRRYHSWGFLPLDLAFWALTVSPTRLLPMRGLDPGTVLHEGHVSTVTETKLYNVVIYLLRINSTIGTALQISTKTSVVRSLIHSTSLSNIITL